MLKIYLSLNIRAQKRRQLANDRLDLSRNRNANLLLLNSIEEALHILRELLNSVGKRLLIRSDGAYNRLELSADVLQNGRLRWNLRLQRGQELLNGWQNLLDLLTDLLEIRDSGQELLDLLLGDLLNVLELGKKLLDLLSWLLRDLRQQRGQLVKDSLNLSRNLNVYLLLLNRGHQTLDILSELLNHSSGWLLL